MISQMEIAEAISEPGGRIVDTVRIALENTQPELAADIVDQGIVLTGGGAVLHGMETILTEASGLPASIAENPLICVALGAGASLQVPPYMGARMLRSEERRVGKACVSTGR